MIISCLTFLIIHKLKQLTKDGSDTHFGCQLNRDIEHSLLYHQEQLQGQLPVTEQKKFEYFKI